ncbi:MAG: TadE/TadG family type IV pilus assembly protein [Bryobacterales bacterium]|nr:pilus assembly protein [Bryobacteraceae bacterium]MDW8131545.1 TadE/TadG family type IV pilus assembly protein [Bryobacterales bacterium]
MTRRGSTTVETILFLPLLLLLLMGTIELGRLTYTYYSIYKALYTLARQAGTVQGANFCDEEDPRLQAVKNFVLTGTEDGSGEPLIRELTPDRVQIRIERYDADRGQLEECHCGVPGCDTTNGGLAPDYIVVTLPDGYPFQLRIPYLSLSPILLRPQVRVAFGGL